MKNRILLLTTLILAFTYTDIFSQEPYRVGTTAANFLEVGYGSIATAMGDAFVSVTTGDLSAMYWNPASLGYFENHQAFISVQPWFVGISANMAGFSYSDRTLGTFAGSIIMMDYGQEDVTTVSNPNGTGEKFDGMDMSVNISYGKKLADWFSFGITAKYISSQIWHETASAVAIDLGAIVNTKFLSWTNTPGDGLNIGMSISNYGTTLTYDGIDLKQSVDIEPDENGNFADIPARYELNGWELPLFFRLGISFYPYKTEYQSFLVAVDALHPNNNSEYINVGGQYSLSVPSYGDVFVRAGYKGLFMSESQYGLSFGFGARIKMFGNQAINFDYSYRSHEVLGNLNSYSIGYSF